MTSLFSVEKLLCEEKRMVGLNVSQPFLSPICKTAPYPLDLIATAACLHFGHLLRRRATHHPRLGVLLHSCFKVPFHLSIPFNCKFWDLGLIQIFKLFFFSSVILWEPIEMEVTSIMSFKKVYYFVEFRLL